MVRYKIKVNDEVVDKIIELSLENKGNIRRRKILSVVIGIAGLVEIFVGGCSVLNQISGPGVCMLLVGIAMFVFAIKQKSFQKSVLKKKLMKLDSSLNSGEREYVFSEDGIRIKSQLADSDNYWNAFKEYGTIDNYLYIKRRDDRIILVKQDDLSPEEKQEILQLVEKNVPVKK